MGAVVGDWLESGLFIEWVFEKVCACGWFLWHTCRRRRRRREWVPCRMQAKHSELTYHMANSQSTPHPCYLTQHNSGQNCLLQTCLKTDGQFWLLQVDHKESAILLVSPRCNNCWHMKSFHNTILVTKWRRSLRIRRRREDLHLWVCGVSQGFCLAILKRSVVGFRRKFLAWIFEEDLWWVCEAGFWK